MPILTVQALLGHKFLDITLTYARLYDRTVEEDYYAAMTVVERRMKLVNPPDTAAVNVLDQVASLLDQLAAPDLNTGKRLLVVELLRQTLRSV